MSDKHHDGRAVIARSRMLGDLFETDIQSYPPAVRAVDDALAAAHAGHRPGSIHGNVYTLTLTLAEARIVNARDPKLTPETLPLPAFAAAWKHFRSSSGE